uniref:Uncharacterized protein n=1 Tax=Candidatus Methanogaster sp. ANME-2c ERB4 TaxID=2759911 RepID=A0A7G9YDA4_9EURY|nr:hypothetical protein ELGAPCHP_00004 [Methanosarcinales archaeon ANME-2c ERB4]QNO45988.1 hypothetical protein IBBCPAGD_00004 [Methanosarcinales archaeon ANME-2c ERB4]
MNIVKRLMKGIIKGVREVLRYIDAVDSEESDIFNFLKEKMKINIEVHPQIFC